MRLRRAVVMVMAAVLAAVGASPVPAHADTIRDEQWHLKFLDVATAHGISKGEAVTVAVTDTGVDPQAAEIGPAVLTGVTTAGQRTGDGREDSSGHGTAMASLIAARGKAGDSGALGIAPRSSILPVRVVLSDFGGDPDDLAEGIDWAVGRGVQVISISWLTSEDPEVKAAIERALAADVVVVAGVGNAPRVSRVGFPAKLPGVLAVGGVDRQGNHASVSVTGPEVMIAAPAVDMLSIGLDARYFTSTGTSDATAVTAGAVALIRSKFPELKGPEVVRRLTSTAQDKGAPGRDDKYGYGVLDIVKALTADVPPSAASAPPEAAPKQGSGRSYTTVIGAVVLIGVAVLALLAIRWRRGR